MFTLQILSGCIFENSRQKRDEYVNLNVNIIALLAFAIWV